jgi:hypothetical protein
MTTAGLRIDPPRSAPKPHDVARGEQTVVPARFEGKQHAHDPATATAKATLAVLSARLLQDQTPDIEDRAQAFRRALLRR